MWNILELAFGTAVCSILTYAVYNLYFHPLRLFPGPLLWRAFGIPKVYSAVRGQLPRDVKKWHEKYGTVVRIGPNDLAFAEPQAWQDIYGLQPGRVQNRKDRFMYPIQDPTQDDQNSSDIIFGGDVQHARLRRLLGPAFTPAATKNLGPMIESYADLLVKQLMKVADGKQVQDMSRWFEWTTFDIMGEFAFGESFNCLETSSSHLFVTALFEGVDAGGILGQLERYKIFTIMTKILPRSVFRIMDDMNAMVSGLSEKRQARGYVPGAKDIFNNLLQNKGDDALTKAEYAGNTLTLLFAGADTSATVMIFGSYLLCLNPNVAKRVKDEVRGAFKTSSEISGQNVNDLKYMVAVLSEVMRLYPPGPTGLARHIVSESGQSVAGHHVPYNTSCAVYQLAANRLEVNFARPTEFLPERWFDDAPEEFANDRKDIYQPFSFGPRSCIGKPLAYMETRILMAKFLYSFDFELAHPNDGWESRTKAYAAWNHSGLKLFLRPAAK